MIVAGRLSANKSVRNDLLCGRSPTTDSRAPCRVVRAVNSAGTNHRTRATGPCGRGVGRSGSSSPSNRRRSSAASSCAVSRAALAVTAWADSGPDGRQALATALFARTDVVGFERMEYELTPDAIELGLGDALPAVFEIGKGSGYPIRSVEGCTAPVDT
jgi:hypothetical protein